ncbi:hypothetical protein [Natranaerobius trueperi]|uniref:hypothetical protein n=1 Tax=Natranaerobius trueperi TaxID=759412 RepID=UPI00146A71D1|nr:hypothetical protein [Natranaerobius trueperi]
MTTSEELIEQIEDYCKELKLPATRQNFKEEIMEANEKNYSHERFLNGLLEKEADLRL